MTPALTRLFGSILMNRLAFIAAAVAVASAGPALAASFSGTFANSNPPAATGGRCPALTVTIGNFGGFYATGTSNFGAFNASQSHCLGGPPPIAVGAPDRPYDDGQFSFDFAAGGTLFGTYIGLLSNAGSLGLANNIQDFIVTGGTGRFLGATGSFRGEGQIAFLPGPPAATLTFTAGTITAPGVPEPAAWAMLITGFGLAGITMRRRRADSVTA